MSAKLLFANPTLIVPDVTAAAEYYRDCLGFEILGIWGSGYSIVERGGVILHFAGMDEEHRQSAPVVPNQKFTDRWAMWDIYVHTDAVEALYQELKAKGAEVPQEPYDANHGNREFHILDLNGYRLAFGQDLESIQSDGESASADEPAS
ncbi:MAG TPA: VOC family protein [Acidobacteriota bacterium]|nr:VOC family protein [Acidobacteriota bacterium]